MSLCLGDYGEGKKANAEGGTKRTGLGINGRKEFIYYAGPSALVIRCSTAVSHVSCSVVHRISLWSHLCREPQSRYTARWKRVSELTLSQEAHFVARELWLFALDMPSGCVHR